MHTGKCRLPSSGNREFLSETGVVIADPWKIPLTQATWLPFPTFPLPWFLIFVQKISWVLTFSVMLESYTDVPCSDKRKTVRSAQKGAGLHFHAVFGQTALWLERSFLAHTGFHLCPSVTHRITVVTSSQQRERLVCHKSDTVFTVLRSPGGHPAAHQERLSNLGTASSEIESHTYRSAWRSPGVADRRYRDFSICRCFTNACT